MLDQRAQADVNYVVRQSATSLYALTADQRDAILAAVTAYAHDGAEHPGYDAMIVALLIRALAWRAARSAEVPDVAAVELSAVEAIVEQMRRYS